MLKFASALVGAAALSLAATAANAASLFFDFDESQSVFTVTSSTPSCPFQPQGWCKVSGALAANPFDSVTIDALDSYTFDFGKLTVGGGVGGDRDTTVFAKLAFTSPTAPAASTGGVMWYVTALATVSAGQLTWANPVQQITTDDGSKFTVKFHNLSGLAFGGSTYAPVTITVDNVVTSGAPEPGTWALMIGGFGLAGATVRRRRSLALA